MTPRRPSDNRPIRYYIRATPASTFCWLRFRNNAGLPLDSAFLSSNVSNDELGLRRRIIARTERRHTPSTSGTYSILTTFQRARFVHNPRAPLNGRNRANCRLAASRIAESGLNIDFAVRFPPHPSFAPVAEGGKKCGERAPRRNIDYGAVCNQTLREWSVRRSLESGSSPRRALATRRDRAVIDVHCATCDTLSRQCSCVETRARAHARTHASCRATTTHAAATM